MGVPPTREATAYLDMVNVFSSHDFCSRWVIQSHNSVLHRPKTNAIYLMAIEIVLCGTIPYSDPWRILLFARSLPLPAFRLLNLRFLISTTYVSSNR